MRVIVPVNSQMARTPDGAVWSLGGPGYPFWTRYLTVFDSVRVVARLRPDWQPPAGSNRVDGPGVEVEGLPCFHGPAEYLSRRWSLGRALRALARSASANGDAVVLRVPSVLGTLLADHLVTLGHGYGVEVVGDPHGVFAPGVVDHPLRPLLRWRATRALRTVCARADAVSYVTRAYLQSLYPPPPGAVTASYSSIDLPDTAFVQVPRRQVDPSAVPHLVSVGSLAQRYKGIDVIVRAMAILARAGTGVCLTHLGDGHHREHLERLARELGLSDQVTFAGQVRSGTAVRAWLDRADLFLMPSRTEGLPRAMIEAMARGVPCVGTSVGGIPELLPPERLVPPDQPTALARLVGDLIGDPSELAACSARDLAVAWEYRDSALGPIRTAFYRAIRDRVARHPAAVRM